MFCSNKRRKQALLQQLFYTVTQTTKTFQGYIIYLKRKKGKLSRLEAEPLGKSKLNLAFESPYGDQGEWIRLWL